ncbi:hypothetical protein H7J51_00225 [Mycobacterium crocinum]|uniref:Transposase n=1 Tax=Mycolicibacterium crocinum TaxID=388459 RepID=A0ABY3TV28_9MYCO|nr:hypothetical protein [Mycolicibacterium crocinum]MCV7213710.1 hypothetical protein [Mycolicibacterium crocinum]ULN43164.1 hypothetical protein MI149_08900 [Mycolicibacterium crocinum]
MHAIEWPAEWWPIRRPLKVELAFDFINFELFSISLANGEKSILHFTASARQLLVPPRKEGRTAAFHMRDDFTWVYAVAVYCGAKSINEGFQRDWGQPKRNSTQRPIVYGFI